MVVVSSQSPRELIAETVRRVLMPREPETVDQWADKERRLADGAEAGRWSTDRVPYWRYPMRVLGNPLVTQVVISAASQTAKTSMIECFVGWAIKHDPAPMMWMWPTEDGAGIYNKRKFTPTVKASPRWAERLRTGTKADTETLTVDFADGAVLLFRGTNSQSKARGLACKYRLADEVDSIEFDIERLEDLDQRGNAYPGGKMILSGVPGNEDEGLDAALKACGDGLHLYHVPCPHCGTYQRLLFEHLRWDGGAAKENADRAAATVRYVCPHCAAEIREWHKEWMVSWGVWVPRGARIGWGGEGPTPSSQPSTADFRQTMPHPPAGMAGLTLLPGMRLDGGTVRPETPAASMGFGYLSALNSLLLEWGKIAGNWCRSGAGEEGGLVRKTFVNGVLSEPWVERGERVEIADCLALCKKVERSDAGLERLSRRDGAYLLGEIPRPPEWLADHPVLVLTGGVDVQHKTAIWTVRGWSQHLRHAWLIDFGTIPCPIEDKARSRIELEKLIMRRFGGGETAVRVSRWAIDSGEGLRTGEIYELARAFPGRVLASKGSSGGEKVPWATQCETIDKFGDPPKPIIGGVKLLKINTHYFKSDFFGMLREAGDGADRNGGDRHEGGRGGRRWFWPDPETGSDGRKIADRLEEYFRQITAEHLVVTNQPQVRRGARPVRAWRKRPGRSANHWLDAEVMAWAAAEHAFKTLSNEDVDRLKRAAAAKQKPPADDQTPETDHARGGGVGGGVRGGVGPGIRRLGRLGGGR